MKKKNNNFVGEWSFLIGIILAVVVGLLTSLSNNSVITGLLVVLGLIVGLLNVTKKEVTPFMMSGIVLIIAGFFGASILSPIPKATDVLAALLTFFVPATIVVAIKNVFTLAKN